jgi:hypothetical protein
MKSYDALAVTLPTTLVAAGGMPAVEFSIGYAGRQANPTRGV